MYCCEECFGDDFLKDRIRESGVNGDCDYCGSESIQRLEVSELADLFSGLLGIYEPVQRGENLLPEDDPWDSGATLADLCDRDWNLFADRLNSSGRENLLDDIFNGDLSPKEKQISEIDVRDLWTETENNFSYRGYDEYWDSFVASLIRRGTSLRSSTEPKIIDPSTWLPDFIAGTESCLRSGTHVYRSRIQRASGACGCPFDKGDMGPPPPRIGQGEQSE